VPKGDNELYYDYIQYFGINPDSAILTSFFSIFFLPLIILTYNISAKPQAGISVTSCEARKVCKKSRGFTGEEGFYEKSKPKSTK